MKIEEEYCLSQYQDLGLLDGRKHIRLKRHNIYGNICVEKKVSAELEHIYRFIQLNPTAYVPKIYECVRDGEILVVIEEYIMGRNLEEVMEERRIDGWEAVRIIQEICNALKIFHHAQPAIICRDLKAENVMLDDRGNIKLVDFNISRVYQDGKNRDTRLLGTAEYAAPEQYGYFQTDNRTDIYALGVLFNYLLSGKFPVEYMVEGWQGKVIKKCTCLDPKERYQTVEELEQDLIRWSGRGRQKTKSVSDNWIPPGFRTRTLWKMIVAIVGYIGITAMCFTMEFSVSEVLPVEVELWMQQSIVWLFHMVYIAIVFDYRGIRGYLPFLDKRSPGVRRSMYVIGYFLMLCCAGVCLGVIDIFLDILKKILP